MFILLSVHVKLMHWCRTQLTYQKETFLLLSTYVFCVWVFSPLFLSLIKEFLLCVCWFYFIVSITVLVSTFSVLDWFLLCLVLMHKPDCFKRFLVVVFLLLSTIPLIPPWHLLQKTKLVTGLVKLPFQQGQNRHDFCFLFGDEYTCLDLKSGCWL